jgi:hypothetical protein
MPLEIEESLGHDIPRPVRWGAWAIGQLGYPIVVSSILLYVVLVSIPQLQSSVASNTAALDKSTAASTVATSTSAADHAEIISKDQDTIRSLIKTNQELADKLVSLNVKVLEGR